MYLKSKRYLKDLPFIIEIPMELFKEKNVCIEFESSLNEKIGVCFFSNFYITVS